MDELKEIIEKIKELEKRVDNLEKRDNNPFPLIGPRPNPNDTNPFEKWNKFFNSQEKTCPACGIKLDRVMGYVCNRNPCPVYPTITC